ncbi:MAG: (d)CMP kinase [Pyrinomonadaceae bacterium]
MADITERDRRDTTRLDSPLVAAEDAIMVDSSGMSIDDVFQKMMVIVKERTAV